MSKPKHLLVVTQYFYPEPFRINDMCQEWVKRGYQVTVLTGIPNYPQGKFYEGYGYCKKRKETWNGINIIRIPLIPRGHHAIGLVCNYFSFVVSGFFWNLINKIDADLVFNFEVSPMTQVKVGIWYAKKHKIPCFLYLQDLWPENVEIITNIHHPIIIKPIGRMVDKIYASCDRIFVTSPSFEQAVIKRGVSAEKVSYWPQYAEEFYTPMKKSAHEGFVIGFAGNIGTAQGLDILPKTAQKLKASGINVIFKIVGDGRYKETLVKEIKEKGVDNYFEWVERQPAEKIPGILAQCDAAFVSFMDHPLFAKTIPAKLQSYMACGMPIIASATGETKRIIQEAECGICSDIGDVNGLAESIISLMQANTRKMGDNARHYFIEHFDKQKLMDRMDVEMTLKSATNIIRGVL